MRTEKRLFTVLITVVLALALMIPVFAGQKETKPSSETQKETEIETIADSDIPVYSGAACVVIHDNIPDFSIRDLQTKPFVSFSKLDGLKRTGAGMACLGNDILPTKSKEQAGKIQPTGWQNTKYENLIKGDYLYSRSHVIEPQLCGDNGSAENLFTGTSYLDNESMPYFENLAASYLKNNKDGHLLYRVTPVYEGKNLLATGVQMEAFSVEDFGKSVCFNVFLYNVQPGIDIDYKTGESKPDTKYKAGSETGVAPAYEKIKKAVLPLAYVYEPVPESEKVTKATPVTETEKETKATSAPETEKETKATSAPTETKEAEITYVLNTNTKKFHRPGCPSVSDMKEKNKKEVNWTRDEVIDKNYEPCKKCNP